MEIDLTSIIIGIAALSTFFVPIGMHQFSQWRNENTTRNLFENKALLYSLTIDSSEIFRSNSALGLDLLNRTLLHLKDGKETLIELDDVQNCSSFKHARKQLNNDGTELHILSLGIQISLKTSQTRKMELPLFEGKEGFTFGDEELIIERWVKTIRAELITDRATVHV